MRRATATSIALSPRKSSPPSLQNFVPSPIAKATPSWVSRWAAAGYRGATIGDFPTRCKALLDDPTDAYANTQTALKRRNRQDSVFARSARLAGTFSAATCATPLFRWKACTMTSCGAATRPASGHSVGVSHVRTCQFPPGGRGSRRAPLAHVISNLPPRRPSCHRRCHRPRHSEPLPGR